MPKHERELRTATIQSLGSQALLWGQPEKFIPNPSPGTCEWIWDQKPIHPDGRAGSERRTPLTGFPEWLQAQEGSPFYWITGRPGSGKSTLMRYIFTRNDLERYMSIWRPAVPPFVIALFAHASGDPLHHPLHQSMHWLIRAIIAQALEQDPTLPSVFLANSVQVPFKDISPPSDEIERALSVFLDHCQHESRALLLLVDGLDVLDASPEDIITFLTWISRQGGSNVKICAAGRPWPAFEDFFGNLPRLIMNDVVEADIEKYVTSSLDSDNISHYNFELDNLSRRVSQKAQGIFLWAVVAMRIIRNYIETGSSILDVNRVFATMPLDLDLLYYHLASDADSDKVRYLPRMLLLKDATLGRSLHFRALGTIDSEIKLLGDKNIDQNLVAIWLHRATKGFLEILPGGFVEYMHPSVREWAAWSLTTRRAQEPSLRFSPSGTLIHDFYGLDDDQINIAAVSRNWRKHILANMTYHAARAANVPFPNSNAVDVANKFLEYLGDAQTFWDGEDGGVWLEPAQRSSTNVYEWAAALGVTDIFENLDDETWVKLREGGDRLLHRAIHGPPRSCLQDWGMSEETYFNPEMVRSVVFNPSQRQQLILKLLEMGIVVSREHLQDLLKFETLVESWAHHDKASSYLRYVKNNLLIPTLADPNYRGDF